MYKEQKIQALYTQILEQKLFSARKKAPAGMYHISTMLAFQKSRFSEEKNPCGQVPQKQNA